MEGKKAFCVQLRDLDEVVPNYDESAKSHMAWAPILDEHRPTDVDAPSQRIQQEYDKYRGIYYDVSILDMVSVFLPFVRYIRDNRVVTYLRDRISSFFWGNQRSPSTDHPELLPYDNYASHWEFCSKLIASIYVDLEVFPQNVVPPNVMPMDLILPNNQKHIPSIYKCVTRFHQ